MGALHDERELAGTVEATRNPGQAQPLGPQLQSARRGGLAGKPLGVERHLALDPQICAQLSRRCGQLGACGFEHERRPVGLRTELRLQRHAQEAERGRELEPDVAGRDALGDRHGRQLGWPVCARGHGVEALQPHAVLIDAAAQCDAFHAQLLDLAA
jgi:hypothetical protein